MKKKTLFLMLFSLMWLMPSLAQNRNVLSIPDFSVANSSSVVLPIDLENTSDVVAVQFTLQVPSGVSVDAASAVLNGTRKNGHSMTFRSVGTNKYMCMINSTRNNVLTGKEGNLLTVPLRKTSSAATFSCPVTLSDVVVATADGTNVLTDTHSGTLTFKSLGGQALCSGSDTEAEDFYQLSSLFDYSWSVLEEPNYIEGYTERGKAALFPMTLTNEGMGEETMKYRVEVSYGGVNIYSFDYPITVRPMLMGAFFNFTPADKGVVASNAVRLSWNNIINAVYDVYVWKSGDPQPASPVASNLSATTYNASSHCTQGETYNWMVVAHNECQEMVSDTQVFSVRDLPDLHVTRVNCSDPVAGQSMTVEWTVRNDGLGTTGDTEWNDYIWLVPDMKLGTATTGSKLLKTVTNVKALDAGESYINTQEIQIDERIYGNYHILITSDMYNVTNIDWTTDTPAYPYNPSQTGYLTASTNSSYVKVSEVTANGKKDNFFYTKIDITVPPLPDLWISRIEVFNSGTPVSELFGGQTVDVVVTIQNKGEAAVQNKTVQNVLYRSASSSHGDGALTTLSTSSKTLSLEPGASTEERYTITIPSRYHGDLYFHAQTDRGDVVYELANTENNWGSSERVNVIAAPGADLQPTFVDVNASTVTANQTVTVSYTVENMGAGQPDVNRWNDRIYLCQSGDGLTTSKTLIATVPITYSETKYSRDVNVNMPSLTGTYYIYVVTDDGDAVFEFEGEDNNVRRSDKAVTFVLPDLSVELTKIYNDTIKSGAEASFEWKVRNQGVGDMQNTRISDAFYVSSSESGANARYIGTITNDLWIAAGSEKLLRGTLTVPYGTALDGSLYVFVKTDANAKLQEASEDNNTSNMLTHRCKFFQKPVSPTPYPDLTVTNATAPGEAVTSTYQTARWTVGNNGNTTAASFTTAVYLSDDATLSNDDVCIYSQRMASLPVGETADVETDFYLKDSYYTKKYFIFVADNGRSVTESDESNNTAMQAVTLTKNPTPELWPDIAVTFAKAPETVTTSQYFTVNWTLSNVGDADAGAFTNGIYLSDDELLSSDDILLVTQRTANLKQGVKSDYQSHVSVSDQYEGQKYLIFRADKDNSLDEDTKANNCRAVAVTVVRGTPAPAPEGVDLAITAASTASSTIATSTDFVLNWTCANTGTADAVPSMVGVYLSDDNALSNDDALLATQFIALLKAGTSISYQTSLNIPDLNYGRKYIIVRADIDNQMAELSEDNNSRTVAADFVKNGTAARADLVAAASSVPAAVNAATDFTTTWRVTNGGTLEAGSFLSAVYLSEDAVWSSNDIALYSKVTRSLAANGSVSYECTVNLPEQYTGVKYLIFMADVNRSITESNKENNYVVRQLTVSPSPATRLYADLAVRSTAVPDALTTSEEFTVIWTVTNQGNADAGAFVSAVYLSDDASYSNGDILLSNERTASLKQGTITEYKTSLSIADKYNGNKYLIFRTNAYGSVSERETSNNYKAVPVTISCAPLPDLKVAKLESDKEFTASQETQLVCTVINAGEVATRQGRWVTEYYLSSNATFNKNNAARIGSSTHSGMLKPGEEYTDTVTVILPEGVSGNYLLFAFTDATDAVYESNESNNVSKGRVVQIYPVEERPVDLAIGKLEPPTFVTAGENITLTYRVENNGQYAATGTLRDVIYLSKDEQWDTSDIQVGVVTGRVNIEAGGTITREATGRVVNVPEGKYYFIVKTNSTRSIPEVSEDNNAAVGYSNSEVRFKSLSLGQTETVNTCGYYKVDVSGTSNSQTVGFNLRHDENTSAALYVSYEAVPSTAKYDYASFAVSSEEKSVILPVANDGCYYILAQDNSALVNNDGYAFSLDGGSEWNLSDMTLTASRINFGATSLSMTEGGTDGWISTEIKGAMFDSIMDFRLAAEQKMIPAERIAFHDQTSAGVTFNLRNAEVGVYDVVSELPNGTQATLPQGFHVIPGVQSKLGIKIDAPRVVHSGSHSPVSIAFANGGTNDIQIKEILIKSRGSYLGKTVGDFKNASSELHLVPEGYEADRFGYISIAPGTQKVINFFMEQHAGTSYMTVYIVK